MMLDWNEYRKQLGVAIAEIGRFSPETVRGYRELSDAGNKTGRLDPKTRELIALAVAVTRQCEGCITVHTDAAILHGAAREEIAVRRPHSGFLCSLATAPQQGRPFCPQRFHHGCILESMPFEQVRIGRSEVAVRNIFQLRVAVQ